MSEATILTYKCTNPECGKLFKMRHPGKAGTFRVSCPHCSAKVSVKVEAPVVSEAPAEEKAAPAVPKPEEVAKTTADNSSNPVIDYSDYPGGASYFLVGERAIITCPHCRERKLAYTAQKEGMPTFTCPGCKGKIRVWFQNPTKVICPEKFNSRQGKLVHVRPLWLSTHYPLPIGEHTIGRYDLEKPSSISIKGDSSMSRRSVSITASISKDEGFKYLLRVLSATNPVSHAGHPLTEGEEIYLNFGDEIRLGGTLFRFVPDDKAPRFGSF